MSNRLIVIPCWGCTPTSNWYPWLQQELEATKLQPFNPVVVADMPNPVLPTIPAWVGHVKELLGSDPVQAARTVFVGHSVGCQAVLRTLAELPEGLHLWGMLCVAGWFWTDAPWESLLPWIETPFDLDKVRSSAGQQIIVLLSNNDRHTSDWQANRKAWQDRLGAKVVIVPGANHFNGDQYPIILQTLLDNFATDEILQGD